MANIIECDNGHIKPKIIVEVVNKLAVTVNKGLGVSSTFTTTDGKTIIVVNGIITSIN